MKLRECERNPVERHHAAEALGQSLDAQKNARVANRKVQVLSSVWPISVLYQRPFFGTPAHGGKAVNG